MERICSCADEAITPSIWWTLLSRIIFRIAGFRRMTSKTGMVCPFTSGISCWEITACNTIDNWMEICLC